MSKVIGGMTMSLDGFVNDHEGSVGLLYRDMEAMHNSEQLREAIENTGAVLMGRYSYDMAQGDFTGYEFQVPIFVLTHDVPETVAKGENDKLRFTFVTDGIESAVRQAKAAAGSKNVTVIGGASTIQQCLQGSFLDELEIDIRPVLLGDGLSLFGNLDAQGIKLEKIKVIQSPMRTHFSFRVLKA